MPEKREQSPHISVNATKCVGCLRCQLACSLNYLGRFSPAEAWVVVQPAADYQYCISFTEDCVDCDICVESCHFGALEPIKEGN